MKSQRHEYKVFVTLLRTYSMHVQHFEIFVVLYILVCYLCIMLERNLIRTYIWSYISSVEFVYEKLIETKKNELKRNHKMERNEIEKKKPLVPIENTNRD
jgi:hypothetical protein